MKRILILSLLLLLPLASGAQNYIHIGPAVYPLSSWGGEVTGDFGVANFTPKLSLGLGVMAFGNMTKTHDEPDEGKKVYRMYAAPQVSLRYAFTDSFNAYLRGGAGWFGSKKEGADVVNGFMYNGVAGLGLSLGSHFGLFIEGGLPFSAIGFRFAL
ncbi:MAG: hypothetical protein IJK05_08715 [Bacteroidales bacterium]|nr:hypothetical protein [Bacteroidales bacterium]